MPILKGKKRIGGRIYDTYLARKCQNCGETVYLDREPRTKKMTVCPRCGQRKMKLVREVG